MGTDYRTLYEKEYLGAWNLDDGDKTLTITRVIGGTLTRPGGKQSKKPVCYFRETPKGLAVNPTNGKTIAGMYGNAIENWVGKRITLFRSMTRNPEGGGEVECIRVRPQIPASTAAPPPAGWSETDTGKPTSESPQPSRKVLQDQDERLLRKAGSIHSLKLEFGGLWMAAGDADTERRAWLKAEYDKCTAAIEAAEKAAAGAA